MQHPMPFTRGASRPGLLALLLLATLAAPVAAQVFQNDGSLRQRVYHAGALLDTARIDLDEEVRVIVQLSETPVSLVPHEAGRGARSMARAAVESEQARFRADVSALAAYLPGGRRAAGVTFEREMSVALNAVVMTVPRRLVGPIRKLGYVRRVEEDRRMQAFSAATLGTALLHGPSSQGTGAGITIAILDTGIDYNHPALGGGFGPNFRVIGGYDFINDDADPMDDHGHGTHVAGIAAGSAQGFSGVAPAARMLAYKVLDAGGSGDMSGIIAAVERALDPNGDGDPSDRAHVLNLSLGGNGDADDALSTAVDNAASAGAVVVVAAGNDGAYMTIGSPASARRAITVGASDAGGNIASFSSRGPAAGSFGLKPDVVAPGVDIPSAWPGGGYQSHSGTSMATPYVAGVAALLLEQHPGWSPDVVKAALMHTAENLGSDLFTQGAGRVRADLAATAGSAILPGSLSFGLVDAHQPVWSRQATLEIRNLSGAAQTYVLSVEGTPPAGVSVSVQPASISVPAGESRQVNVSLSLTNAQVPYTPVAPPQLVGHIVAQSNSGSVRVPFGMIKTSYARVVYDEEPFRLWFIGQDRAYAQSFDAPPSGGTVLAPPGTYTVVAVGARYEGDDFVSTFNAKEQIVLEAGTPLDFRSTDLSNVIRFVGRTHTGASADVYMVDYTLQIPGHSGGLVMATNVAEDRFRMSNLSGATLDALGLSMSASGADYAALHRLTGDITSSVTLQADPAAYKHVLLEYTVPPGVPMLQRWVSMTQSIGSDTYTSFYNMMPDDRFELRAPFRQTRYISPTPAGSLYSGISELVVDIEKHPMGGGIDEAMHIAPLMRVNGNELVVHRGHRPGNVAYTTSAEHNRIPVGLAPPLWYGRMVRHGGGQIWIDTSASDAFFLGSSYERMGGTVEYDVFRQGTLVASGENVNARPTFVETVGAGAMVRVRHSGHRVLELDGRAEVELHMDARNGDPNPPRMTDLQVRADGTQTAGIPAGATGTIHLKLVDESAIGPVSVQARRRGSSVWAPIAELEGAGPHTVTLPAELADGYYGLRVIAQDGPAGASANRMDYRAEPAFAFRPRPLAQNGQPTAPQLQEPANEAVVDPQGAGAVTFRWVASTDPDQGDVLSYALRLWGPGLDTTVTVWNGTEATLDLSGLLVERNGYRWSVTTSDGFALVDSGTPFWLLTPGATVDTTPPPGMPGAFALDQNYPNPFNPTTTIAFSLANAGPARLAVYDLLGRRLATLVDDELPQGPHRVQWDASALASGTYIYRLESGGQQMSRRLVLVK